GDWTLDDPTVERAAHAAYSAASQPSASQRASAAATCGAASSAASSALAAAQASANVRPPARASRAANSPGGSALWNTLSSRRHTQRYVRSAPGGWTASPRSSVPRTWCTGQAQSKRYTDGWRANRICGHASGGTAASVAELSTGASAA